MSDCAKRKDISGGNAPGLQDQVPGQKVTRQIAVEVEDSGTAGSDPPEDRDQQDIFNAWKEKVQQSHRLCHPAP